MFGAIGVALPLTMFTGSDQLKTALDDAGTMSVGLLIALVIAKQCTFAVSQASGFVGGPIFPALFIGGTAGILVHAVLPGVPLGLAFTCMLAAWVRSWRRRSRWCCSPPFSPRSAHCRQRRS